MVSLPDTLRKFLEKAKRIVALGKVGDIEFAGGTYQVQVNDPDTGETVWAFLQFDPQGSLKDRFCSCEGAQDVSSCVHIAAAFLRIYGSHSQPLHVRFQESLWNQLCWIFSDRFGDDTSVLNEISKGIYIIGEDKKFSVFTAKGTTPLGKLKLREIFSERPVETEESSLKFSNLPVEEIILWREGRPSSHLRYELSFWSDLAKWLMITQDKGEKYTIDFHYSPKGLPDNVKIKFPQVELVFSLTEAALEKIVPSLRTVDSPLSVHIAEDRSIQEIIYDKEKGEMHIIPRQVLSPKQQELDASGVILGGWIFLRGEGFYAREQHYLLETPVLKGFSISEALTKHCPIFKKYLKTPLHDEPQLLSYSMKFDTDWNLHVKAYLKHPGDLETPFSKNFGNWVYIENEGFFHIEGNYFENAPFTILKDDVADFITHHRVWLNTQEGFQIHVTGVESKLAYELTDNDYLKFHRKAVVEETTTTAKDFGPWIYVDGQGFFSKTDSNLGQFIREGMSISPNQIPFFIRSNQAELQFIPGFFSSVCPIAHCSLDVELTLKPSVKLIPLYEMKPAYRDRPVKIFDDCAYVQGEGFSFIPNNILLPERYRHVLEINQDKFPEFFSHEWEHVKKFAHAVDPRLSRPFALKLTANSLIAEKEGYALELSYVSEKGAAEASDLWQALHNKDRFVFTKAGLLDLAEERFKWMSMIKKNQIETRSNKWTLSTLDLFRLSVFDPLNVIEGKEIYQSLVEFEISAEPDLRLLQSHLRPYQLQGAKWLWFLYQHQLSGLLCDDMGLGKTHQAMALLAAVIQSRKAKGDEKSYFLVVCPTSVIYHWEEKMKEFIPSVRVCTFHGSKRSLKDFHRDYDVILTSYGIWRNECELLSQVQFEVAIFDEIQAAKNQTSRIHTSLLMVKATTRLGLTGTPIENRLRELKSLFDLILPRYMPSEMEFRQFFINPIEKEGNLERRQKLSRYIKPFVLRRIKKDVLVDLPEKVEEIAHCDLSSDQIVMYNDILHKMRQAILSQLADTSTAIPYLHIFSVLSSLKQICNHPAAFLKEPEAYKNYQSGKWDLFIELMNEAQESGQKIVVFSQYLAMLDIIEIYLHENRIPFASLRGSTIDRAHQVKTFNLDPECRVFVGSLHAAGLGIDLTAASVVIHYDRWWNEAREIQATDRVHRFGQTRGVQVFKLVTKGTFEERIDEMITRKGKLMADVIGVDDQNFVKKFDRNELIQLLQDVQI